ncbi:translation initiation factor IF-2-like [Phyllostomus hastatus]|uniref:translation initiation factor IF-2-like n=1 Tax=Phyllostomus hastatus TaxID=9423 RepID=UPI001E681FA9|nr:translation initiation factor IF-2-like [Phyllostomus hastatus]
MFWWRPSSSRETALRGAPLACSPPPHLQPASRPPPASGPQAPRAAVRSRPPPGDRGGKRARRGGPRPSGRGGSSQQQRQPLTWKHFPCPCGSTNFSRARNAPFAFPGVTHQGALGAPSRALPTALSRIFKPIWAAAHRATAGFLVGRAGTRGRAASCSLRAPVSSEGTRVKSHPTRGERGRRAGEAQASGGRSSGLPPQRHPGDTGTPSSRYPACVDSCEPSGMVPRRPRRPENSEWQPGGAGAGSTTSGWSSRGASTGRHPSRESEQPGGGQRNPVPRAPRAPAALPTAGRAAALPGAE